MSRSIWKPLFVHPQVRDSSAAKEINVHNRSTTITESRAGRFFQIYNGRRWYPVVITSDRVGHTLGEFAPTRKRPIPKKKKVSKKKLNGTKNSSNWSSCRSLSEMILFLIRCSNS